MPRNGSSIVFHLRGRHAIDAPFRELDRKCRGMRSFGLAALNCLIRNEPGVAATPNDRALWCEPSERHYFYPDRELPSQPIQLDLSVWVKWKHVFVTIVQKSFGTDRFEMPVRTNLSSPIMIVTDLIQWTVFCRTSRSAHTNR